MRILPTILALALVFTIGCGGDDEDGSWQEEREQMMESMQQRVEQVEMEIESMHDGDGAGHGGMHSDERTARLEEARDRMRRRMQEAESQTQETWNAWKQEVQGELDQLQRMMDEREG
jgi:hypothetical protein